jgi:serine/threonine-protein kinase
MSESRAVFLSYASQDADAARRIAEALRAAGVEVWFDETELRGGDAWDVKIRGQISSCALFVPIISAATQARLEGYFRLEWKLAAQRSHTMADERTFLLPVVIDATRDAEAKVPAEFKAVQWTRIGSADSLAAFCERVKILLGGEGGDAPSVLTVRPAHGPASVAKLAGTSKPRPLARAVVAVAAGLFAVAGWVLLRPSATETTPHAQPVSASKPSSTTPAAQPPADLASAKSIAVLPFVNLSADKQDEYLSDGMTEELLNVLAQVPGLRVPGRSSSFAFKGKTEDNIFRKVGEQLHVATVLEGSVRKAGDKLRITAQLINVTDGFHLWSQTYDRDMKDILAVQTEVAQQVAQALKVKLGVEATRALAKTQNPEAHRLYLLGRYHFGKATQAGWTDAIKAFNQAIELDPNYALAYCGLADNYGFLGGILMPGKEAWSKEKDAAKKAVALDPNLADARLSLALALAGDYDWPGVDREIGRALELNPNLALAHDQYAWVLTLHGRFDEAAVQSKMAVELDPLSPLLHLNRGYWLYLARRFDEANTHILKALELDPNYPWALRMLGWSLLWKGDKAGALELMEKAQSLDAEPFSIGSYGHALAVSGDRAKAGQILRDLENLAKQRYVSPAATMVVYLGLGEKEKALEWLEKCYEDRDPACWPLKVEPFYDPLRTEPRFQALLKKVFPEP